MVLHTVFTKTLIVRSSTAQQTRKAYLRTFSIFSCDGSINILYITFVIHFHASLITHKQNDDIHRWFPGRSMTVNRSRSGNMYDALNIICFRSASMRFLPSKDRIFLYFFNFTQYIHRKLNIFVFFIYLLTWMCF